jgi:hypothetical protein
MTAIAMTTGGNLTSDPVTRMTMPGRSAAVRVTIGNPDEHGRDRHDDARWAERDRDPRERDRDARDTFTRLARPIHAPATCAISERRG